MALMTATIRIHLNVEFEDNGEDDLRDQAIENAMEKHSFSPLDFDEFEVIGKVEEVAL